MSGNVVRRRSATGVLVVLQVCYRCACCATGVLQVCLLCYRCATGVLVVLQVIVGYPQTKPLTSEEKDLVWKFRFYLSAQKKVSRFY